MKPLLSLCQDVTATFAVLQVRTVPRPQSQQF